MKFNAIKNIMIKLFRAILWTFGIISFIMLMLSFTDVPYHAYYNLGNGFLVEKDEPNLIVIMGGSGMPSPDGLIRTYYAARAAKEYESATILIAFPQNDRGSTLQLDLMAAELTSKGIDSARIIYEPSGFNTRSQALNAVNMYADSIEKIKVLIVTSPEHVFRSVKCFEKAGFDEVYGLPAIEQPGDEDSLHDKKGRKRMTPDLNMRYNMWSYLNYELLVLREYVAIAYYKLRGWI